MARSSFRQAGSVNLRGRREKMLRCGCCVVTDLRPKFLAIEHAKEVREGWNNLS